MDTNLSLVRKALLKRNYFHFDGSKEGEESLKNLEEATELQNIIIRIEKSFNVSQYDFQYNAERGKFIRLDEAEDPSHYLISKKCKRCSVQCFKSVYSVNEFIELCKNVFEPVSVRVA